MFFSEKHTITKNYKNVDIGGHMSIALCNMPDIRKRDSECQCFSRWLHLFIVLPDRSREVLVKTFALPLTDEEGSDQHPSIWHAAHSRGRQSQRLAPAEECWHLCAPTPLLSLCGGGQGKIHFLTSPEH